MKIFILFLLVLISPIELRRHNDDQFNLEDLLNNEYNHLKYRPNKEKYFEQSDDDDDDDDDQQENFRSSHKKVIEENNEEPQNQFSDDSLCIKNYDIQSEKLVKVKDLKNGAHLIRFVLIDEPTSKLNIKENCIAECCSQKSCDLAMLSEQRSKEGYKCYLFACNGSCTIASHQDYSIMIPKKDSQFYTKSAQTQINVKSTTIQNIDFKSKKSVFRETTVILFFVFGLLCTIILIILLIYYCREARKRGRKSKQYAVDADYLINGLYL